MWTLALALALAGAAAGAARGESLNGFDLAGAAVAVEEILPGGPPRDGIPALDHPEALLPSAAPWPDATRVLGVALGGEARAYPIPILDWHELVNDSLGDRPILVSYCPLCRTGMVFDRRVGGVPLSFGVSGLLFRSDVLMFDRATESLWSQVLGRAVTGPSRGQTLELLRSRMDTLAGWLADYPGSSVLSKRTGHRRDYTRSPYLDYARSERVMFPVPRDERYPAKTLTLGVRAPGSRVRAFPAPEVLRAGGVVRERFGGDHLEVRYDAERDVFRVDAPAGVEVIEAYWFAWAAFHPTTTVFTAAKEAGAGPAD